MKKWFIYILECEDGSLYTGITINVEERFNKHRNGKGGKYTASHKPVKIVYTEIYNNRSKASKREIEIKGWTRDKKISILKLKMPG
ncbi:MAG: hypothetical protein A2639_02825 [Candidatus Staskawiczbacteria bacterium RIFCSPHIGHO2_01_FULL_34_27]|uniref:GIY-YIG domain-containing protein n=2 Tax=Candidatus Staskawicziibacteriota TaxID=1817916 RepID=A0A1G2HJQ5_9BACT|nr:MAG: hypothetical protein A2639_02825 [Candidatus Staskawiczbacteria bacterium RIFCSPHIGHO2_01_FULL_34_27]OGZ69528.1 MAG: hypothetical protein A3D35_01265 [Candidatus Staskawiczbacteria bacterium RIFCSPHIGHO2_02_FULL_34_9]